MALRGGRDALESHCPPPLAPEIHSPPRRLASVATGKGAIELVANLRQTPIQVPFCSTQARGRSTVVSREVVMRVTLAALIVVSACASAVHQRAPVVPEPAAFSLALQATPLGWAARCDTGCRWHEAAFECPTACNAVVDAYGLRTVQSPTVGKSAFSFRVERTADGARAESDVGTAWRSLSWSCGADRCRARITGYGVDAPTPVR